jgi:hypothetical protein
MEEDELFVVAEPTGAERAYCCVLGSMDQVLALAAYRGPAGYASYRQLLTGETFDMTDDVAFGQCCLMASFEGRQDLADEDRAVIRRLGLRFRGRRAWPLFRSYRPGFAPWFLDGREARLLAVCLEQALEVCTRRAGSGAVRQRRGKLPARLPVINAAGGLRFTDGWVDPPPAQAAVPLSPPMLDELRIQRLRKRCQKTPGAWEVDWFHLPNAILEAERPFYPLAVSVVDGQSGMVLGIELVGPGPDPAVLVKLLLAAVEQNGRVPVRIMARRAEIVGLLGEVARRLDTRLEQAKLLAATREFQAHLLHDFSGER